MMTMGVHNATSMPVGSAPATPVIMGFIVIEDEPASLHLGVAVLFASKAGHLALVEWEIHMFGGIAVDIVDP